MVFNVLASINVFPQSTTPSVTYNTFNKFAPTTTYTPSNFGSGQQLAAGQCSAMSETGQYIIYTTTDSSGLAVSSNYGVTFTLKSLNSASLTNCCMTGSGQYQYAISYVTSNTNNFLYSNDYGNNWYSRSLSTGSVALRGMACCYEDYRYIAIGGGAAQSCFYYSADGGVSFTKITGAPYTQQGYDISDDGTTVYVLGNTSPATGQLTKMYKFTNMLLDANTVNSSPSINTTFYDGITNMSQNDIVVSSNQQYILTGNNNATYGLLSQDGGTSWSQVEMISSGSGRMNPSMSRNGKYMLMTINGKDVKYSNDYGNNWASVVASDFISNAPDVMTKSWNSSAVSRDGYRAFIVTQLSSGYKAYVGTSTVT